MGNDSPISVQIPANEVSFTTGNKYKLFKDSLWLDIRKYSFNLNTEYLEQFAYVVDVDSVDWKHN